jgi:hypothetical protein
MTTNDPLPIVTSADALKIAIVNFLADFSRTTGFENRYPVASTELVAVPAMLDDLLAEFDPSSSSAPIAESARRGALFVPRCMD